MAQINLNFPPHLYLENQTLSAKEQGQIVANLAAQLTAAKTHGNLAVCNLPAPQTILLAMACLVAGWKFQPVSNRYPISKRSEFAAALQSDFVFPQTEFNASLPSLKLQFDTAKLVNANLRLTNFYCSSLLTSGSSGMPKIVDHEVINHLHAADFCNPILQLESSSCWLMSLPLFHASGYAILMRCLRAGASIAVAQSCGVTLQDLQKFPITHVSLVATQLFRLLQNPAFNAQELLLKHIMLGGSAIPVELMQAAQNRGFRVLLGYGMTETAAAILLGEFASDCSLALTGAEPFEIIDGEIMLKGRQVAEFYWENAKQVPLKNAAGLFATGDLAKIKNGRIYITGRKGNRFISGGENIQPELIEQRLQQHYAVDLALVVPFDDLEFGQRPLAFVRWNNAVQVPSKNDLEQWLKQELPSFMCPVEYREFPQDLPLDQKIVRQDFVNLANC